MREGHGRLLPRPRTLDPQGPTPEQSLQLPGWLGRREEQAVMECPRKTAPSLSLVRIRKLESRDGKESVQGRTARTWQSQGLNPGFTGFWALVAVRTAPPPLWGGSAHLPCFLRSTPYLCRSPGLLLMCLSSFSRLGQWGSERYGDFSRVTQPQCGRDRTHIQELSSASQGLFRCSYGVLPAPCPHRRIRRPPQTRP